LFLSNFSCFIFSIQAIFSAGKTPSQIAAILDDMAGHVNELVQNGSDVETYHKAILATR
jgi:uncharacterized protein YggL (DUF469 family)